MVHIRTLLLRSAPCTVIILVLVLARILNTVIANVYMRDIYLQVVDGHIYFTISSTYSNYDI